MEAISNTKITCPNCKHEFSLEDSLSRDYENEIKDRYRKSWEKDQAALQKEREDIQIQQKNLHEQLQTMLIAERSKISEDLRKKVGADYEQQLNAQAKEIEERNKKVKDLIKQQTEFEQQKRAMQEEKESMALKMQKQLNEERVKIQEQIQKQLFDSVEMKMLEKDKQIADQNRLIDEMKRKSEQGSMQLQGEVMELALENLLHEYFPMDEVKEVGKGVKGADVELIVKDAMMQACGSILFESKRTKNFDEKWIDKLKTDMRQTKADAAVIVTTVMPKNMTQFGQIDGVWICKFNEVAGVTALLREGIIKVNNTMRVQDNKGDKMTLLYNYMTSDEFRQQMEAIGEGFRNMQVGINKEKVYMNRIWAEREKQLEKALINAVSFYGSVKGIAGNSVPDIKLLGEDD